MIIAHYNYLFTNNINQKDHEKIVISLYKGPLSDKKIIAGLFNDSGKIIDLFESN